MLTSKRLYIFLSVAAGIIIVASAFIFTQRSGGIAGGPTGGPGGYNPNAKADIPLVSFNPPAVPANEVGKHPNILLIIADDMGLDADPCHPAIGSEKPNMPNLVALCKQGVTFDNVWVNPVCSPTRSTMMTGQYGFRTGVTDVDKILSPDTETLADVLADASKTPVPYANAFIGKWHMSGPGNNADLNAPSALGVQYFAGFLAGGVSNYFNYAIDEQGVQKKTTEYTTTVFTNKAIEWIDSQQKKDKNRPWFMWLAYNAPHAPFHLPPKNLLSGNSLTLSGSDADIKNNPRPYYLASLEALDKEMGRLLASISPEVLANTTVIFIGDNGTPAEVIQAPYSAEKAKASVYEGGVWGVLTISGKGVTRKGVNEDALVNGTDIFATIADIAGVPSTAIGTAKDSISFKQALTSAAYDKRNFAYTEWMPAKGPKREAWAVRNKQYKLIQTTVGRSAPQTELYDLIADPYENNNLITPTLSAKLKAVVEKLSSFQASL